MQVTQDIRQPFRQGREVIRRLAVQFGSRQSHFPAVNGFEQRDGRRMIRRLLRQAGIQACDLFVLAFQTIGDLDFQQAGHSRRQCQQVGQPPNLGSGSAGGGKREIVTMEKESQT